MTVIAWDGRYLAADMQATIGDHDVAVHKIRLDSDPEGPIAFAITGAYDSFDASVAHYYDRSIPSPWDEDNRGRLIVVQNRKLSWMEKHGTLIEPREPCLAFGSGMDFALGALYSGASAEQAVKATIALAISCGRGISVYDSVENKLRHEILCR